MKLDDHPVAQIATVVTLIVALVGGAWTVLELHRDLEAVATMLREIKDDQGEAITTSEVRHGTRGAEHREMSAIINRLDGLVTACQRNQHMGVMGE